MAAESTRFLPVGVWLTTVTCCAILHTFRKVRLLALVVAVFRWVVLWQPYQMHEFMLEEQTEFSCWCCVS